MLQEVGDDLVQPVAGLGQGRISEADLGPVATMDPDSTVVEIFGRAALGTGQYVYFMSPLGQSVPGDGDIAHVAAGSVGIVSLRQTQDAKRPHFHSRSRRGACG